MNFVVVFYLGLFVLFVGTVLWVATTMPDWKSLDRIDNINQVKFLSRHYPFSRSRPDAPKIEIKAKEFAEIQEVDGKLIATLNGITYTLEKVKE